MQKILVIDHSLNSESLASCSIEHRDKQFYGINTSISIDDNLLACKPDMLLINKHFVTQQLLHQMIDKFPNKTKIYDCNYLIPNFYVRSSGNKARSGSAIIILHENNLTISNEPFVINNVFPAIYSYAINIHHPQLAGLFDHAKQLFDICDSKQTIIDASGGYLSAFCKFYGWEYYEFKPGQADTKVDNNIYLTNKEIYEQNM